jgi:hypothetical protein
MNDKPPAWWWALPVAGLVAMAMLAQAARGVAPYPVGPVAAYVLAIAAEVAVLLACLRPRGDVIPWSRALLALVLFLGVLWLTAQDSLGAPAYVFVHQQWVAAACALLLVVFAWTAFRAWQQLRELLP